MRGSEQGRRDKRPWGGLPTSEHATSWAPRMSELAHFLSPLKEDFLQMRESKTQRRAVASPGHVVTVCQKHGPDSDLEQVNLLSCASFRPLVKLSQSFSTLDVVGRII